MKTKDSIICILFLILYLFPVSLFSQTDGEYSNLLHYWYFKDRLKYFVVPGPARGESQIGGIRNRMDRADQPFNNVDYGQHGIYFGYYLGVLATEFKLLMENNRINEALKVQNQVYLALRQYRSVLDSCEMRWYPPLSGNFDGFFIRWDVPSSPDPEDFWTQPHLDKLNQGLDTDDLWNWDHFGDFLPGHPGWADYEFDYKSQPKPMSQDEAIGILLGLSLIYQCMAETSQRDQASEIAYHIIKYISNGGSWVFRDPLGHTIPDGSNAIMQAYGFAKAGEYFGYNICDFLNCAGVVPCLGCPPFFITYMPPMVCEAKTAWDQVLQTIIWGPGDTQNSSMEVTLAAIGDSWQDPILMCENTTAQTMFVKSHEFNWEPFYFLLYKVLHPEITLGPDILDNALGFLSTPDLCEGPYFYCITEHAPGSWACSYRWHKNLQEQEFGYWVDYTNPAFMGNYNGMDYMLLYNLYLMGKEYNYGTEVSTNYHAYMDLSLSGYWPSSNGFASVDNPAILIGTNTISSNATIMNLNSLNTYHKPGDLNFQAGTKITLIPGFVVENGSLFNASIKSPVVCTDFYQNTDGFGNFLTSNYLYLDLKEDQKLDGQAANKNSYKNTENFSNSNNHSLSINSDGMILLYPNPTGGKINIVLKKITTDEIISTFVFNPITGLSINANIISSNTEIDLSELKPGIYFLKILTRTDSFTYKIIKI